MRREEIVERIVEYVNWNIDDLKTWFVCLDWNKSRDKVVFQYEGPYTPDDPEFHRPLSHGSFPVRQYQKGIEELREKGECLIEGDEGCSIKLTKTDKGRIILDFKASPERAELCSIKIPSLEWDVEDLVLKEKERSCEDD